MPRSLSRGDYNLVMAIESSSRANSWYRVLADRSNDALSCDCPPWTFKQNLDDNDTRSCSHTQLAERLVSTGAGNTVSTPRAAPTTTSPLLAATQAQWPGLQGIWSIEQRTSAINDKPYQFVLLRLDTGNGDTATGVVAFAQAHHHSEAELSSGVAGWAGYAIAAEVARLGGFPMVGQPPEHFRVTHRPASGRTQRRTTATPNIGLWDILRVGDVVDQGDGLTPIQRAANTLRLFLGEEMYDQLERQGFIDVPSVRYASEQRVYRLRRDPAHLRDRRIRVFERGRYVRDFCVVRAMDCPADDGFLTNFLGLLSDEDAALSVVQSHNIFPPYSDSTERESIPAVWRSRAETALVG